MDRLSHLLPNVLRKRGLTEHAAGAFAVHKAKQWLQERFPSLSKQVTARCLREHVLTIECGHSIALQEMKNSEVELIVYLSQECPIAGVKEIRIIRI